MNKNTKYDILAMLIIMLCLVLLKCDLTAQPDSSQVCSSNVGVKYTDVHIQSGGVWAAYVILDHVTGDTLDVWVRDSAVIQNESEFINLRIHSFICPDSFNTANSSDADAIALNSILIDILYGMLNDRNHLDQQVCTEPGKADLQAKMNIIRFKGEFVQDLRSQIEANVTGRNLEIWNAFKYLSDYNAQEIINICDDYLGLLSQPCIGTGGAPLDIRLGGRLERLRLSINRLIQKHEDMQDIFRP